MSARRSSVRGMKAAAYAAIMALGVQCNCTPAVAQSTAEPAPAETPIAQYVAEAAQRFSLPEAWIYAVMGVESAGDIGATSVKGAMGLMQVMPGTYADLRLRHGLGPNPYDPRDNILAGAAYLRELYDRYGHPGFLAAYNAGPGRYEDYLAGRPLPLETQGYLTRLVPQVGGSVAVAAMAPPDPLAWTRGALFIARATVPDKAPEGSPVAPLVGDRPTLAPPLDRGQDRTLASLFVPLSSSPR
jgi:soluble lytic murein transglycosylase-like protein